jgi:hypothetical protein
MPSVYVRELRRLRSVQRDQAYARLTALRTSYRDYGLNLANEPSRTLGHLRGTRSLPDSIRNANSLSSFKILLKTYYFKLAFDLS